MAVSDRLGDAVDFGRMRAPVTTRKYATRWLVGPGVLVIGGVISGALSATGVGALVAPFLTFDATVAGYYLYGGTVGIVEPAAEENGPEPVGRPAA